MMKLRIVQFMGHHWESLVDILMVLCLTLVMPSNLALMMVN